LLRLVVPHRDRQRLPLADNHYRTPMTWWPYEFSFTPGGSAIAGNLLPFITSINE
jgi:hypothetical protein